VPPIEAGHGRALDIQLRSAHRHIHRTLGQFLAKAALIKLSYQRAFQLIAFVQERQAESEADIVEDIGAGTDYADKVHPHFYCNAAELAGLFAGFELLSLSDRQHARPGSWHWHLIAERV
jgi:hypothetical protein